MVQPDVFPVLSLGTWCVQQGSFLSHPARYRTCFCCNRIVLAKAPALLSPCLPLLGALILFLPHTLSSYTKQLARVQLTAKGLITWNGHLATSLPATCLQLLNSSNLLTLVQQTLEDWSHIIPDPLMLSPVQALTPVFLVDLLQHRHHLHSPI